MQNNPYQAPQADLQNSYSSDSKSLSTGIQYGLVVTEIAVYVFTAIYFYAGNDLQKSAAFIFFNGAIISVGFVCGIRTKSIRFALLQIAMFLIGMLQLFILLLYASVNC